MYSVSKEHRFFPFAQKSISCYSSIGKPIRNNVKLLSRYRLHINRKKEIAQMRENLTHEMQRRSANYESSLDKDYFADISENSPIPSSIFSFMHNH